MSGGFVSLHQTNASLALPAWFGKLPGMGDFAQRRLDAHFMQVWDNWLQRGLLQLRTTHSDWLPHYLQGPVCFFALGAGLVGERPWLGVLVPSVDAVGRYFPLTLVVELEPHTVLYDAAGQWIHRWWGLAAHAAVSALENDLNSAGFDAALEQLFAPDSQSVVHEAPHVSALPGVGQSHWFMPTELTGMAVFATMGLPDGAAFNALFGMAERAPVCVQAA